MKAEVLDKTKNIGGTTVHYKVVLPKNYDAEQSLSRRPRVWRRTADHERGGQRHRQEFS